MTRRGAFWAALALLVPLLSGACARLPEMTPLPSAGAAAQRDSCDAVFPRGRWQFVHAIEAALSGGGSVVLGVSRISSADRRIHSLIMTVEGMVLFEAERAGVLRILRAVPPFDSRDFARGLMGDIAFIFFAPQGPAVPGKLETGAAACRYRREDGAVVDVVPAAAGGWEVRQYDPAGHLIRRLRAADPETVHGRRIARRMTLEAHPVGGRPYRLKMKLIEALPTPP